MACASSSRPLELSVSTNRLRLAPGFSGKCSPVLAKLRAPLHSHPGVQPPGGLERGLCGERTVAPRCWHRNADPALLTPHCWSRNAGPPTVCSSELGLEWKARRYASRYSLGLGEVRVRPLIDRKHLLSPTVCRTRECKDKLPPTLTPIPTCLRATHDLG